VTSPPGSGVSSSSPSPSPSSADPLAAMRPNPAVPDPSVVDAEPWPFTRAAAGPSPSALLVEFTTDGSDCQALGSVDVTETSSTVTVTLKVGRRPGADCGGARSQLAAPMAVPVTLSSPLGRRPVLDGAK
jgi:hypothetical protein